MSRFIGIVSAYAYAVSQGYTGTEEEYAELMASYATVAEEAAESAESASQSATQAGASASTASTKASEASQSATQAGTKASQASTSATQAGASATSASQSAQTATTKASEASASASTAGTKASEASTSASTASTKASEASASATAAQTAQGLAESARDDTIDAKTDAETARDMAQQYAESIDPDNIYSAYPTDTASGSVVSFADGANNIPMKSMVVDIEPAQSGSGDPSPTNIRPISGWTGAQVVRVGKNLWNPNQNFHLMACYDKDGQIVYRKGAELHLPDGTYAFSASKIDTDVGYIYINVLNADGSFVRFWYFIASSSITPFVTTLEDGQYIIIYDSIAKTESTEHNIDKFNIQIEKGSTTTEYKPYTGNTYPVTFPTEAGTVYGGTLDVTNGVLTVDRAMVDLGTLSWYVGSNPAGMVGSNMDVSTFPSALYSNPNVVSDVMCEKFKTSSYNSVTTGTDGIAVFGSEDARYIRIFYDEYIGKTPAEVKADLDGVKLIYTLLTPITYHLTPTEIKSLLGDNNIWADAGNTEVIYRADTAMYIEKKMAGTDIPMIADSNIVSGSYFMIGSNLYKATANIANGAAVVVGTNAVAITMAEALNEINA